MAFEGLIDMTNHLYNNRGVAVINKRPTPMKITERLKDGRLVAQFTEMSTVDYDGTYQGKSIVFEAKSVRELDRFDLKNLHQHQVDYLDKCHKQGAISFVLITFERQQLTYLLPYTALKPMWDAQDSKVRGSKSISLETLDVHAYQVQSGRVPVDYLAVVDKLWVSPITVGVGD